VTRSLCVVPWMVICLASMLCAAQGDGHAAAAEPAAQSNAGGELKGALAGKPVSVAQLEGMLAEVAHKRDSAGARELYELRLTERLSSAKLDTLKAAMHKARARAALVALADASAFLNPPDDEVPVAPAPDIAEQRHIVGLAVDYLVKTVPKLPNFFATRTTIRYDDTTEDPYRPGVFFALGDPLHESGIASAIVVYRDHKEVVDAGAGRGKKAAEDAGLVTRGTFGPILSTVMFDAVRGELRFSHWEQGGDGAEAVFRFSVAKDKSHYDVAYTQPTNRDPKGAQERPTGYHGEVAFDPASGAILRLALEAEVEPDAAMVRADVMVEYGPVEIGGKNYICPVRSVALSQGRVLVPGADRFGVIKKLGPEVTRLNDVVFSDYHMFRSEMRVLTGDEAGDEGEPEVKP
jgi:hypothetical protein